MGFERLEIGDVCFLNRYAVIWNYSLFSTPIHHLTSQLVLLGGYGVFRAKLVMVRGMRSRMRFRAATMAASSPVWFVRDTLVDIL